MRSCGAEVESTEHYLLRGQNYPSEKSKLLKGTYNLISSLLIKCVKQKVRKFELERHDKLIVVILLNLHNDLSTPFFDYKTFWSINCVICAFPIPTVLIPSYKTSSN